VLAGVLNAATVLQRAQDGETETDLVVGTPHHKSLSSWDMLMSSPLKRWETIQSDMKREKVRFATGCKALSTRCKPLQTRALCDNARSRVQWASNLHRQRAILDGPLPTQLGGSDSRELSDHACADECCSAARGIMPTTPTHPSVRLSDGAVFNAGADALVASCRMWTRCLPAVRTMGDDAVTVAAVVEEMPRRASTLGCQWRTPAATSA
jgi:hypothetical protein